MASTASAAAACAKREEAAGEHEQAQARGCAGEYDSEAMPAALALMTLCKAAHYAVVQAPATLPLPPPTPQQWLSAEKMLVGSPLAMGGGVGGESTCSWFVAESQHVVEAPGPVPLKGKKRRVNVEEVRYWSDEEHR